VEEHERVTIVYGKDGERVTLPVLRIEEHVVVVERDGEELRFSRRTGFELKSGGSWSAWRMSGKDHRRMKAPDVEGGRG
jgi:hypothetical protein